MHSRSFMNFDAVIERMKMPLSSIADYAEVRPRITSADTIPINIGA